MSQSPKQLDDDEPVDERLAQLVSYLDGELDDTQSDQIERTIINDPDMRSHADILSRTWAMLDDLEEVSASKHFTQATLETISTEAVAAEREAPGSFRRSLIEAFARYKVLPCFLLGVLGVTAGMMLSGNAQERRLERSEETAEAVKRDALVVEKLDMLLKDDLYRIVPSAEALQQLNLDRGEQQAGQSVKETP